jgi:hypothetical protein
MIFCGSLLGYLRFMRKTYDSDSVDCLKLGQIDVHSSDLSSYYILIMLSLKSK